MPVTAGWIAVKTMLGHPVIVWTLAGHLKTLVRVPAAGPLGMDTGAGSALLYHLQAAVLETLC